MMHSEGLTEILEASPALRQEMEFNEGRLITHVPFVASTDCPDSGESEEIGDWGRQIRVQGACPKCFTVRSANGACSC